MYEEPSLSQRAADAVAQWQWEDAVRGNRGTSGGGGPVGGGIGNLAGWVVFFGMVGGILGFILGQGLWGAISGALLCGGGMWVLGKLLSRSKGSASRKSVIAWTLAGIIGGAILGLFIGSPDETRMMNAATNWAIFGGIGFGGWGLFRRR